MSSSAVRRCPPTRGSKRPLLQPGASIGHLTSAKLPHGGGVFVILVYNVDASDRVRYPLNHLGNGVRRLPMSRLSGSLRPLARPAYL